MPVEIPKWVVDEWARAIDQRILEEVIEKMSQKRIYCYCHGLLPLYPDVLSPWEDVWLRWKGKPGRTVYHAAPCLECHREVVFDLELHKKIREADPQRAGWYREDDAEYHAVLKALETNEFACSGEGAGLSIYTKEKGINRKLAERMMAWWLEKEHGIKNPKFVWDRPEFVAAPYGFGDYSDGNQE